MQSDIQWTFYITKLVEWIIFSFAIWRSLRVCNKKFNEAQTQIEDDKSIDTKS